MAEQKRRVQTLDGLPVYDAEEPLTIIVVKEDIRARFRKDPAQCAIAQACKREMHTTEARAYRSRVYVKQDNHWLRYALPEMARAEVQAYDRGGGFSEGSYQLKPIPLKRRSGGKGIRTEPRKPPAPRGYRVVANLRQPSPLQGGALEPG